MFYEFGVCTPLADSDAIKDPWGDSVFLLSFRKKFARVNTP